MAGHGIQHMEHSPPAVIGGDGAATGQESGSSGAHQYWQVGLVAGPQASDATAMATRIVTRLPQRVANHTTNYFWIGSYLADGSFIQVGYYVAWYDPDAAGWFYCAFTPSQRKGPCAYGSEGSAGANGSVHTYVLEARSEGRSRQVVWQAALDDWRAGSFAWASGTTGQNTPGIYAESSGFAPHAPTSQLGPVDFPGGIATVQIGAKTYVPASHARAVYGTPDICPPYGATSDGRGGALLGSGLACPSEDTWLW
jgi:hypothetical protein